MVAYLLKSGVCLAVLFLFYKVFLEKENFHVFKRFYLIGGLVLAFAIPIITFTTIVEVEPNEYVPYSFSEIPYAQQIIPEVSAINYWPIILWTAYGFGVVLFTLKFLFNLYQIGNKIRKNPKKRTKGFTHVLLQHLITPHTFFSYIFLNKQQYEQHKIPQEVFWHEETHAKQKHSADVLLIELLQIVFWFNPLLYFIKNTVKLNHEFLADKAVLNKGVSLTVYQEILLAFSSNQTEPQLANALNYSSIKKRFTVMKTKTSKKALWIKSLILLPLIAVLVYSFSEEKVVEIEKYNQTLSQDVNITSTVNNIEIFITKDHELLVNEVVTELDSLEKRLVEINPNISFENRQNVIVNVYTNVNTKKGLITDIKTISRNYGIVKMNIDGSSKIISISNWQIIPKSKKNNQNFPEGATEAMMEEYRVYLNSLDVKHRIIRLDEYKRNEGIYGLMTEKQRLSVDKLPKTLVHDIPKKTIRKMTSDQFEKFKDENIYALWIDGKHVSNNVLNNYKYSDFKHYGGSIVKKNARTKKHPQPNQYWLYTPQGFEKSFVTNVYNRYKKSNADYEVIRKCKPHFKDRSKEEQLQLLLQYNSMEALYKRLFNKHLKLVKRPIHPQHPYVKLVKGDKTTYHLKGEVPPTPLPRQDEVKEVVIPNNDLQKLALEYNTIKAKQNVNQNTRNSKDLTNQLNSLETRIKKGLRDAERTIQDKATPEELAEYNKLAKSYNVQPEDKMVVKFKDLKRLDYIFNKMTAKQKENAEPFPNFPPPNKVGHITMEDGEVIEVIEDPNPLTPVILKQGYKGTLSIPMPYESRVVNNKQLFPEEDTRVVQGYPTPPPPPPAKTGDNVVEGKYKYESPRVVVGYELKKGVQDKATKEEVAEYNKLSKHYNNMPKTDLIVKLKDVERLKFIFNKMTINQKSNAESFPNFPPPPPPVKNGQEEIIEVPIKNPPPPPIPENATPEEKEKRLKAIQNYAKMHPDKVTKSKDKNGNVVEIVEMPSDNKGWIKINNQDHYFVTKDGKTTYYNKYGKEVNAKGELKEVIKKE